MTGKEEKVKFVAGLMELLPVIKAQVDAVEKQQTGHKDFYREYLNKKYKDKDLSALLLLSSALYFVFSSESVIVDNNGSAYTMPTRKELVVVFMEASSDRLSIQKEILERHLIFYKKFASRIEDCWVFQLLFGQLNMLGYELICKRKCSNESPSLQRTSRLIDSLRKFLTDHTFKDKFSEEQLLLDRLNLPRLQQQIQDQILVNKFEEMSPCKVVIAYYKVYQKLPLGY
ncbi:MAG: hypothetical protein V4594_24755 [Bacteroidota bacterium]